MRMPLIVKPTDRSGSRGICKIESKGDIRKAIEDALRESFERKCIVEEFIEVDEYSCECISFAGKHYFLAFTQKFTTGAPHYIERGHFESADILDEMKGMVQSEIFAALDALEISDGASHCEFKLIDGKVRIIEIGARMGGDFIGSHLVKYSMGYDFLKMVIDVARGEEPVIKRIGSGIPVMVRFILDDEDKELMERAILDRNIHVIEVVEEKGCQGIVTDSSTRKGYFLIEAESVEYLQKYFPYTIT